MDIRPSRRRRIQGDRRTRSYGFDLSLVWNWNYNCQSCLHKFHSESGLRSLPKHAPKTHTNRRGIGWGGSEYISYGYSRLFHLLPTAYGACCMQALNWIVTNFVARYSKRFIAIAQPVFSFFLLFFLIFLVAMQSSGKASPSRSQSRDYDRRTRIGSLLRLETVAPEPQRQRLITSLNALWHLCQRHTHTLIYVALSRRRDRYR